MAGKSGREGEWTEKKRRAAGAAAGPCAGEIVSARPGLTGTQLKMIAMVSMLIDHSAISLVSPAFGLGRQFYGLYLAMRAVGRLAFPIYGFLLVEGFLHTKNRRRYLSRLIFFAVISEIPFDLVAFGRMSAIDGQNVFFTLAIALGVMWLLERYGKGKLLCAAITAAGGMAAFWLRADYGFLGVLYVTLLYLFRWNREFRRLGQTVMAVAIYPDAMCVPFLCSIPLTDRYNGLAGRRLGMWAYWFYPVHLSVLYALSIWI